MDDRAAEGVIYVRDTTFESFRNRMTGEGATNWSAVFNHPATHVMLEMRNPQKDVRMLKFKAQLIDKETGKPTVESMNKVMSEISKVGQGGRIEGAYIESDKFKEMNDYAQSKKAENDNPDRKEFNNR